MPDEINTNPASAESEETQEDINALRQIRLDKLNELCAAGAEAVSINSERIVSTSSIRCVGNTILVNNKRCAPPFEIKAIGDSSTLESGLNIRGGVIDVLRLYKIEVNVTKMSKINIGKFGGTLSFRHAETVTE